jgi:hypothetical protein
MKNSVMECIQWMEFHVARKGKFAYLEGKTDGFSGRLVQGVLSSHMMEDFR